MTDIGQPAIVRATVLNPFNIQEYPTDKEIRLDIRVEDESKAVYNVEVQTDSHTSFFDRMLYYWARTYGTLIQRGEDYRKLRPVRSIVITEFPVFPELKELHAVFEIHARENSMVLLSKHFQMHVLRLGDWLRNDQLGLDSLCVGLQRWMQFWGFGSKLEENEMSTMLQDVPEVRAAYEEFKRFTADPKMRERAESRKRFLDEQAIIMNDVREEGLAEGEAKNARENAQKMKRKGYPVDEIAEITGLPLSEIEQLN
jgi:predicted transposase/invertase (TIGR01784 family)